MDITQVVLSRRTCKAYDPNRKVSPEHIEQLKTLLRYAPSSVNSQPWHFFIAATDAAKQRLAKAAKASTYAANEAKILNASHVIVFCARTSMDEDHLTAVLDQEDRDGRFPRPEGKETQRHGRSFYAGLHRYDFKDTQHWMEKQVYIALGTLLFGASALGIDATPIEGFDQRIINEELALRSQGLTSVVMAALGYRSQDDFNADLPKSRLPAATLFTEI